LVNSKSINFNLNAVVLSIVHLGNRAYTVPSDLIGSVKISELKLDWRSSSKSSIGNAGSIYNGIIVSVVSSVKLEIGSSITSSQSWGNCVLVRNTTIKSISVRVRISCSASSSWVSAKDGPF
jgi:hypothetical protein